MKILLTGAGGNLGRVLAPALAATGHELRLFDFRPLESSPFETVQGDVRNLEDVRRAVAGVDAIVHAAALHGIHLSKWKPEDFWAINVTGTFHVFEAAREAGIKRVVLCSTMGVYGESARAPEDSWNLVTEALPLLPGDVYGLSKKLCEELGATYGRRWGVTTVALRLGMFVPEGSLERYGFRLLFGGVDDRDVAQAAERALNHAPENGFAAFNIMSEVPFSESELTALRQSPLEVLETHYPGLGALLAERQLDPLPLLWGRTAWSVEKAKALLGYQPQYNFDGFLSALRSNDTSYYPYVGLPWWGV
ncbi:NAD-dependent epimerase/dehydratase family protein [Armatimonas rosea]|uniref:Nucleoside-diphosphate-sugar epimerase n=1 Tax=Armatimonas rosea TaxID=685828 RepID=A0A7W9W694_ARMRO|nr:NAD(P)-dependent oxidoreductase [Armatimonas rosea]MBB6049906.1 nucleoside-diphosphate-sugar epimerase [Armatimonas rosea]